MAVSAIAVLVEISYLQRLLETNSDPLAEGSGWALEVPFLFFALIKLGVFITILVLLMGFMLRSAQLIKSVNPAEIIGRPGWSIWGFFIPIASYIIPYQILGSIRNFAKHDDAKRQSTTRLLLGFWIPYSLANYLSFQIFRDIEINPSYSKLVDGSLIDLASAVSSFVSSLFLIWLIPALYKGIQKRMSETAPVDISTTS